MMNQTESKLCTWCGKPVLELTADGRHKSIHKRCSDLKKQVGNDLRIQKHFNEKYKN